MRKRINSGKKKRHLTQTKVWGDSPKSLVLLAQNIFDRTVQFSMLSGMQVSSSNSSSLIACTGSLMVSLTLSIVSTSLNRH